MASSRHVHKALISGRPLPDESMGRGVFRWMGRGAAKLIVLSSGAGGEKMFDFSVVNTRWPCWPLLR